MALGCRALSIVDVLMLVCSFEVLILTSASRSNISKETPVVPFNSLITQRDAKICRNLLHCEHCSDQKEHDRFMDKSEEQLGFHQPEKNIDITAMYTDASGAIKIHKVKSKELSESWIWQSPDDKKHVLRENGTAYKQSLSKLQGYDEPSIGKLQEANSTSPEKLKRLRLRQERKERRSYEITQLSQETEIQMEAAAIERTKQFNSSTRGPYSIWRREYQNPHSDSFLKLMKDQIIMAKAYASIAFSKRNVGLNNILLNCIRESQDAIGEASSDAELHKSAHERAKAMGHVLSMAKLHLYDAPLLMKKFRAMIQYTEENVIAQKKKSAFLLQLATKTVPKQLHCLSLQLTVDFFYHDLDRKRFLDTRKLEDPSLYHYAIFSDNILATSVVINSTVEHVKEPEKHVFHIVTNRLNFAAMTMWFFVHSPPQATIHVESIDDFKWLNSSYCPVLRQLETARMREYYFKANHPSSVAAGDENLKYRNPKYLSMLNHLRFYIPEIYPKIDKILFLDDDVVVQKDLTPLWAINMKGMVNGAVDTCKGSFHRLDTYVNFSSPEISENFDPRYCAWAFGMNIFDLKEWKKRNITGTYHYWQGLNKDRTLWKLGSLPPGLLTFYGLTYKLDRSWHVLALGYNPGINLSEIKKAAVIHYNGNYKPWSDLVITKYKSFWSKYVKFENPYLQECNIDQ